MLSTTSGEKRDRRQAIYESAGRGRPGAAYAADCRGICLDLILA